MPGKNTKIRKMRIFFVFGVKKRFAQHGGHVIKAASVAEKSWYIVPLCLQCNELKDNESFYVTDSDLVKVSDLT